MVKCAITHYVVPFLSSQTDKKLPRHLFSDVHVPQYRGYVYLIFANYEKNVNKQLISLCSQTLIWGKVRSGGVGLVVLDWGFLPLMCAQSFAL